MEKSWKLAKGSCINELCRVFIVDGKLSVSGVLLSSICNIKSRQVEFYKNYIFLAKLLSSVKLLYFVGGG